MNSQKSELEGDFDMSEDMGVKKGDVIVEKPLLNTFFDTEEFLFAIEKTYKGYQKRNKEWVYVSRPIASTSFINKTINMLRSVITPHNFHSRPTEKRIDQIMLEKNIEYIELCKNTPVWELPDENVEMAINIFDHSLQMYMGIIENGEASKTIIQLATGTYDASSFEKTKTSATGFLSSINPFSK